MKRSFPPSSPPFLACVHSGPLCSNWREGDTPPWAGAAQHQAGDPSLSSSPLSPLQDPSVLSASSSSITASSASLVSLVSRNPASPGPGQTSWILRGFWSSSPGLAPRCGRVKLALPHQEQSLVSSWWQGGRSPRAGEPYTCPRTENWWQNRAERGAYRWENKCEAFFLQK